MPTPHFADQLIEAIRSKGTPCVVGLDPNIALMPESFRRTHQLDEDCDNATAAAGILAYNEMVLDAVADLVPAVKPQSAYFEQFGSAGILALEKTIASARSRGLLVILDVKRNDIGSTSAAYARAYLRPNTPTESDSITLLPYLGEDSLEPFISTATEYGKGLFVCVKTSNPGSQDIQDRRAGGLPIHTHVANMLAPHAQKTKGRNGYGLVGAVVGATWPDAARSLRAALPHSLFLVPGIGAQGGDPAALKPFFQDGIGAVVAASRSIMYPHRFGAQHSNNATIRKAAEDFIAVVKPATRDA